jgi:thiol:disulfide interchange protein
VDRATAEELKENAMKPLFISFVLLALVACSPQEQTTATTATNGGLNWTADYPTALAQAKTEKKLVMVDLYTDWCSWCKKLDRDVYANGTVVEKLTKSFVVVKVNPEKNTGGRELAKKFGTQGYPHIVFVNGNGDKVSEISGYVPADEFLKELDSAAGKR